MAALQCGIEQIVLGRETGHWRKAGKSQHKEGQQACQQRLAIPQAADVFVAAAAVVGTLKYRDDAKGSQVEEGIAEQVEENGGETNSGSNDDANEQVAGMGDTGVCQ